MNTNLDPKTERTLARILSQTREDLYNIGKELQAIGHDRRDPELDVPYVPSTTNKVEIMMRLAKVKPGEMAIDLGSGDGRVVIALANSGAKAVGYEINPDRVKMARENIKKQALSGYASIRRANLFDADIKKCDVVTIYGITSIMTRLEEKLLSELKPGARVVSNCFTFPTWRPTMSEESVYLYIKD